MNPNRKIRPQEPPETTAERAYRELNSPEVEAEFKKEFSGEKAEAEVRKADEWDAFITEHELDGEVEVMASREKDSLAYRKKYLVRAVSYLDSLINSKVITASTQFAVLLSFIEGKVYPLKEKYKQGGSTTPNHEEESLILTLKALLELEEEGFDEQANTRKVINELQQRFNEIKDVEWSRNKKASLKLIGTLTVIRVMNLQVGQPAPGFNLPDQSGKKHTLEDYKGQWVLLYFYPEDDTPGCTKEACGIRDQWAEFKNAGLTVLGVSPDSVESHQKFISKYGLPFTLLSDTSKEALNAYESWGKKTFAGKEYVGVHRNSFLINPEGKIVKIYEGVKPQEHAKEVLAHFAALKM